jgi:hypothetical protein
MNDFVLQLYDKGAAKPFAFYNINDVNFQEFINHNEQEFKIRILNNADRTTFIKGYTLDIAKERIKFYSDRFVQLWKQLTGFHPSKEIVQEYLYILTKNDDESILNYTQVVVTKITTDFVASKLNISQ